jgi:hypothetical protein
MGLNATDLDAFSEGNAFMSRLRKAILACAGASICLGFATPAQSQVVPTSNGTLAPAGSYTLNMSNGSDFAAALVTTDATGQATNISGLVDGTDPITALSSYAGADNLLYNTGAWVSFGGLSFSTNTLGDFNFYNSGLGYYGLLSSRLDINGNPDGVQATAQVTAVPEPSTWAMMLLGFMTAGLSLRRQRREKKLMRQVA